MVRRRVAWARRATVTLAFRRWAVAAVRRSMAAVRWAVVQPRITRVRQQVVHVQGRLYLEHFALLRPDRAPAYAQQTDAARNDTQRGQCDRQAE